MHLNTRCNIAGVIVCIAAEMRSRRCYKSIIFILFTWVLMWPHAKKSKGVRSRERAAHNRGESRQYEAQGLPNSGLWDAVFPTETTYWRFWTLFYRLSYGLHSFLRRRRPRWTFLITNIPSPLELVDQTSNGCSRWSFCTVRSTKPFFDLSKGQSIESPT